MEYFSILNLNQEPFSNSPDPAYFFQSQQHIGCLQKLELSLRLRRGLNVVIGDVGTGKTTLCRQLIRKFADDKTYETHLILDPQFSSPAEFLGAVIEMFEGALPAKSSDEWQAKELIKQYLFRKGVHEKKTVVLIIDEGQKIPLFCLEILREFLNYETNEYKLLQIAVFAQKEFEKTLAEHANLADRINLYHELGPMNFRDTRLMIQFRLNQASQGTKAPIFFSYPALWAIFRSTGGYPRKIINLCHRSLLTMIIQNRNKAGWFLVRSSVRRAFSITSTKPARRSLVFAAALIGLALIALTVGLTPQSLNKLLAWKPAELGSATVQIVAPQLNPEKAAKPTSFVIKGRQAGDSSLQKPVNNPAIHPGSDESTVLASDKPEIDKLAVSASGKSQPYEPKVSEPGTIGETAPEAVGETRAFEDQLPLALGRVALKRNETLWKLIVKVYGVKNSYIINSRYIKSVTEANPNIVDPDYIKAGRLIALPAIPVEVKPLHIKIWWVKVGEKDRLDEAVNVLRDYPEQAPPVRIVPYWNRRLGLRFAVVLKECFYDETSAQNQLPKLPSEFATKGKIIFRWGKDTVFFADPFS